MTRDHRKLRVFQEAHQLAIAVYSATSAFPPEERFGLQSQLRRGAVSIPANIVEGSARRSSGEYIHFLNIALGSAAEVDYLIQLSQELEYLPEDSSRRLSALTQNLIPGLTSLIQTLGADVPSKSPKPRAESPS